MTDAIDERGQLRALMTELAARVAALEALVWTMRGSLGGGGDSAPGVITPAEPNAPR